MNRTTWLQDRRMEKFCDLLSRWKARELSAQDAGEILGFSERQFRRYRRRYEEEGLTGLFDKRLGKASARRDRAHSRLFTGGPRSQRANLRDAAGTIAEGVAAVRHQRYRRGEPLHPRNLSSHA